jgi:hypothetical protein
MRNRLLGNHSIFDGPGRGKFTNPNPVFAFYRKSPSPAPTPTKQQCRPEHVQTATDLGAPGALARGMASTARLAFCFFPTSPKGKGALFAPFDSTHFR